MKTSMQARESAAPSPGPALPAARGWGDGAVGAPAGPAGGGMLPGVAAAPVQRSAMPGQVIQRGRNGKGKNKDRDRGTGGGGGGKRQGKKSQRDKKYGFMNDEEHGAEFMRWLHGLKQKEGRRHDFNADEVRRLEVRFKRERGIPLQKARWRPGDEEVTSDNETGSGSGSGSDTDEESGDDILDEHPEKNPTERRDEDDDEDDSHGGGHGGGLSGAQEVTVP